jgi:hypothetical protein
MSNRSGDRYACGDPNCGCEVEVRRASGTAAGAETSGLRDVGVRDEMFGADTIMDVTYVRAEDAHLPPPVSGIDPSAAKSLARESGHAGGAGETLRCFCGGEMREVGTGVGKSRVATVKL